MLGLGTIRGNVTASRVVAAIAIGLATCALALTTSFEPCSRLDDRRCAHALQVVDDAQPTFSHWVDWTTQAGTCSGFLDRSSTDAFGARRCNFELGPLSAHASSYPSASYRPGGSTEVYVGSVGLAGRICPINQYFTLYGGLEHETSALRYAHDPARGLYGVRCEQTSPGPTRRRWQIVVRDVRPHGRAASAFRVFAIALLVGAVFAMARARSRLRALALPWREAMRGRDGLFLVGNEAVQAPQIPTDVSVACVVIADPKTAPAYRGATSLVATRAFPGTLAALDTFRARTQRRHAIAATVFAMAALAALVPWFMAAPGPRV